MRQRELIAESTTPDGDSLTLTIEQGEYVVRVRGETLMSARQSGSEQMMAKLAFDAGRLDDDAQILVGGLGMGFTLRALLDQAAPAVRITVIELLAEVVQWNRGMLAPLARAPLDDPRVSVELGDVLDWLADKHAAFDVILLDIDNGPEAFTVAGNDRLYRRAGLDLLHAALRGGGLMILWSAFRSPAFEKRLQQAGFVAHSVTARARGNVAKGARHTLFVARKKQAVSGEPRTSTRAHQSTRARQRRER